MKNKDCQKGDLVRCRGTFTDGNGAVVDPSVVKFSFFDPNAGPTTNPTIYTYGTDSQLVRQSIGIYYVDLSADIEGIYQWRLYSTGSGQAADEGTITVQESNF